MKSIEVRMAFTLLQRLTLPLLIVLHCVWGQIPSLQRCPDLPVVRNFDTRYYSGKWYEIEKYFTVFQLGTVCVSSDYSDQGNGTLRVKNRQQQPISGEVRILDGTATIMDTESRGSGGVRASGKLGFSYPTIPLAGVSPYWVLDTDYKSYSIVWSCTGFGLMSFRILWFLARQSNPPEQVRTQVYSKLKQLNIPTSPLQKTKQEGCSDH